MAYPLPDKPSIAVLPFDNLSGDPNQEYFSDGLTEEIIAGLSKVPDLFVIARNSSFIYKGKPVKVQQVSEELGVRYVLEGSVRKEGDRVRITAQLIDAVSGHHMWSKRYDRKLDKIFDLQDEIMRDILVEMQVQLTEGVQIRVWHQSWVDKKKVNLDAYWKTLQARWHFFRMDPAGFAMAKQLCEEAIEIDPNWYAPYAYLAFINQRNLPLGEKYARKTLQLNDSAPISYITMGQIYLMKRQWDKAIAMGERALELDPNGAEVHSHFAYFLHQAGRFQEAIPLHEKAFRLDPYPPSFYYYRLGIAYFDVGRYDDAVDVCKKGLKRNPRDVYARIILIAGLIGQGHEDEARAEAQKVLKILPKYSIKQAKARSTQKNKQALNKFYEAMANAGFPEHPPLPLPEKPSIAVLAFDNISGDPKQEYFSDGISEEIINALSKTDQLFVIARNSSFTYKGKPVNVKQISRELGVRYVLEGSVRKSDDRVRITAQLIDATTGHHLWSERYDRELKDIFELQDEITKNIVVALEVKLTQGEQARIWSKKYKNLDVYLKRMEAWSLWNKGTLEGRMRHGQLAQEIIDMAPESPSGYTALGYHYWVLARYGKSPRENLKKAFELAQKAISLDESYPFSHSLLGSVYLMMRQYEKAIAEGERAIELYPNGADTHGILGETLNAAGRPDEAIEHIKKGIRLNPFPAYWYFSNLGSCYGQKEQYEKALTEFKKALRLAPKASHLHANLAVIYILLGREEEAHASAAKCMELAPWYTVSLASKMSLYKDKTFHNKILDAMRKAGFPE